MRAEHWMFTIPLRLRSLFRRARADEELDDEIRDHVERKTEEYIAKGLAPQEARRQALVEMGGIEKRKEECRDTRRVNWIQDLIQDLHFGVRMLRKSPGFTAIAVLTLALGIGANAAIFSVINGILLHPLPYKDPNQLVFLMESNPRSAFGEAEPSLPDIQDWRVSSRTLQEIAAFDWQNYFLTGEGEPHLAWGLRVSPQFFSTLGVQPIFGRTFSGDEHGDHIVVISHSLWTQRFGGDPKVIGRVVVLNDTAYTIVGVLPTGFVFPPRDVIPGMTPELFVPLVPTAQEAIGRDDRSFDAVARLRPSASLDQTQAELSTIALSLEHTYPSTNKGWGIDVTPVEESAVGNMRLPLSILACSVGLVLLLACSSVVNLLLARNESRCREISVRAALGAGPSRIKRQLLTESALLAFIAAVLGVVAADWSLKIIISAFPANIPRIGDINVDGGVLGFSVLLASITTILFGLFPAFRASRPDIQSELKGGNRFGHSRLRIPNGLVVFQVAISVILLIGAGLLIRSMGRLLTNDIGFDPTNVLTARLELPPNRYSSSLSVETFHRSVLQQVRALPGIRSVALVMTLPLSGRSTLMYVETQSTGPGQSAQRAAVEYNAVTSGYFNTLRVSFIAGRTFSEADNAASASVAIVNEAMAREFWPHANPIGKYFRFGSAPWLQVIGLVKNEKYWSLADAGKPEFYLPYEEASRFGANYLMRILTFLVIRSAVRPEALSPEVRSAVWEVDPREPVVDIKTMSRLVADSIARRRFVAFLLSTLAGLAVWLAFTGMVSVQAYSVSRRTHEIGIRMAVGAQPRSVLRMILGEGMLVAAVGIAGGLAGSLVLTRFLQNLLFGVKATDLLTFGSAAILVTLLAAIASYVPARRAMRVDPMVALRYE